MMTLSLSDLVTLTKRLIDLLNRELEMMSQRRPRDLQPLIEEKAKLAAIYQRETQALKQDRTPLVREPGVAAELKSLTLRFTELLAEQGRKLKALTQVTDGVIQAIGREVVTRSQPVLGYGRNGTVRTANAGGASFALNRTI
ncbi:hypothetical protein [Zavarzinia sp. CC-PAN008]|uniref:hypothetical protein n=1 Tax=Zavarzinia sp. CC-PAN008 TaxID=3243332 RepID=UPI003F7460B0